MRTRCRRPLWLALLPLLSDPAPPARAAPPPAAPAAAAPSIDKVRADLVARHGEGQRARVERGLRQVAALWRSEDGDLHAFAREHFIADPAKLDQTFARFQAAQEQIDGHLLEISRELRRPSDTDMGPLLPVDGLMAGFDPAAHLIEDLFQNKLAFVALLNFPLTTLDERLRDGKGYSRRAWAEVRLAGRFARRVPGAVRARIAAEAAAGELYISEYNLWMHHLLDAEGKRPFRKGLRLISHWNLRDELRAGYADPAGLGRQRLIAQVMERIVTQEIPQAVINNPRLDWDPVKNTVAPAPPAEVEDGAPAGGAPSGPDSAAREPDTRYARILANFRAQRLADPYSPTAPTLIARSFEQEREIPEARVVALLTEVCASPLVQEVAALIAKRLGRPLLPHDLWYNGFLPRGRYAEERLDQLTRRRYPTARAFADDIPNILKKLGFRPERASFLASHIAVDASRGAGHALQAARRGDLPRLRTRVGKDGMDYKGYNIAVHELGHNVEQVFSLYQVDHTLLAGVPNNAFTEALAFVFQGRDLELLGLAKPDAEAERMRVLADFWATYEIAGVGLTEIAIWHWLYEHPDATPAALREASVRIAREHWRRYYAKVLGDRPEGVALLGIYSHMIQNTLYLPDYPLGHLIAFQIEEHLKKAKGPLGAEFERMASFGMVTPDLWMEHATGAPISTAPLLRATAAALRPSR